MNRTAELVLGLIGAIIGVLAGLFVVFVGGVASAMNVAEGSIVSGVAWFSVLFSAVGLVGSVMVKNRTTLASVLMLIAAIGGFICLGLFYVLPGALLLVASIMGLARKGNSGASA
ncbi:MAG: DUF4064 domain-containing protein [Tumebacillaceae bacterium]